ncbi:MAG: HDOD domain-containing protein [Acidobacteriota bacterium]|nr:HDOD domain-containing protein [Acidobacteriota bacterium]
MLDHQALDTIPQSFLDEYRNRLSAGRLELPLLPHVSSKILELAASDQGSAAEFSDLIHKDQALAGQVLRVANSSVFARRGNIVSLKQAVTRLGLDLLSEIAMTSMLAGKVFKVNGFQNIISYTWRHALATGCFAKEIARLGRRNVESAFLCGLLHTIGKPLALNTAIKLAEETGVELNEDSVTALLGLTHQQVGEQISAEWKLPEAVRICILHFHDYTGAQTHRNEATMTYLATRMGHLLLDPENHDEAELRADPVHMELNLYPDDVDKLLGMREHIEEIVDSLEQGGA